MTSKITSSVPSDNASPIIGGYSDYTLFGADTSAWPFQTQALGSLTLTPNGTGDEIIHMPITGGDGQTILHQGTGLDLSVGTPGKTNYHDLIQQDFRYDLQNHLIYGNVTSDGTPLGNMALYTIAGNGVASGTAQFLAVIAAVFGSAPPVGSEAGLVQPSVEQVMKPGHTIGWACRKTQQHDTSVTEQPIIGGTTTIALTGTAQLQALGICETSPGSAPMHGRGKVPVVRFAISGGTENAQDGSMVVLDQGSGLELSKGTNSVAFRGFLFDTQNHQVDANVFVDGTAYVDGATSLPIAAVFDIGTDMTLTLTAKAADVLNGALHTQALQVGTLIGSVRLSPVELPACFISTVPDHCSQGAA
jgi:hypothetical protein